MVLRPSRLLPIVGTISGEEILACEEAGIAVYLPKPMTSDVNAKGRFGKQDFLEAVQARLDRNPDSVCVMRVCRQTVEHPFGTISRGWGGTHFQLKSLKT